LDVIRLPFSIRAPAPAVGFCNPGATSFGFWTRGQSAMEPAARFSELNPY
jgi:hypothetical protein